MLYTLPHSYTMRPVPMAAFTPPVTGVGHPSAVVANMFDTAGVFRPRTFSGQKRRRMEQSDPWSAPYDLTRDYPPLTMPPPLVLDVSSVRALLVEAASKAAETEALAAKKGASEPTKTLAGSAIALFKLIEAVVEKAIIPLAENSSSLSAVTATCSPPPEDKGKAALRKALETAEKTAIVFNSNLGNMPIANRTTLSHNFTEGLRLAAIDKSGADPVVATEAVRAAADALSCAAGVEFLGQSSRRPTVTGGAGVEAAAFCTMPVRLTFEDRGGRQYFERTMREKCGIRSTLSLPNGIRAELKKFHNSMKEKNPEKMVMTRPDAARLCFICFTKTEGDKSWSQSPDTGDIDPACLNPTTENMEQ